MAEPQKMKVIEATYTQSTLYQVPDHWEVKDVFIKWDNVYYKGKLVEDLKQCEGNTDYKMPTDIIDCCDGMNYIFEE